jgi:uncharacterized protein YdeI (YjbR/CyaY-like superfamily)
MEPIFFHTQKEFRVWLEKNHQTITELQVGFYKVKSGKISMSWSESVDQALCFGWIDGVRKSIDDDSYKIRFTPRKKTSIWSAVNIKKIEILIAQNLMQPAGLEIYKQRSDKNTEGYSSASRIQKLPSEYEKTFKSNNKAWKYFQSLAPSYKKSSIHWVMSAKRQETQEKRLNELIAESEQETNRWKHNKYNKK